MQLKGKKVIVTGGAQRLGRALTERLIAEGASVLITYRKAQKEAQELEKAYPGLKAVPLDLESSTSIQEAHRQIETLGFVPQVLVNNASTFYPKKLLDVSEKDWEVLHSSNVRGHFFFTQKILSQMKEGVIINMTDIHAEHPLKNFSAYVAQKAALKMITKNWALELAPKVRVNSVSPGSILFPEGFTEEQKAKFLESCPLGREGKPADIVEAVLFLIRNDYITGFDLKVDGGSSLTTHHI